MPYALPSDIQQIVNQQVASGKYSDAESVLRAGFAALSEADSDLAAIQEAISEWKAGDDGLPVDEVFAEIRTRQKGSATQ